MPKLKKTVFLIYITIGYFIFSGDSCDKPDPQPTTVPNPNNVSIRLEDVNPRILNSPSDDFQIKVNLNSSNGGTFNIALRVKGANGCYAITRNSLFTMSNGIQNQWVTIDFESTCNTPGVYTVQVEANSGGIWYSNVETITLIGGNQNTAKVEYDYHQGYDLWDIQGSHTSFLNANVQFDKGTTSESLLSGHPIHNPANEDELKSKLFSYYFNPQNSQKNLSSYPVNLLMSHDLEWGDPGIISIKGVTIFDENYFGQDLKICFIFIEKIKEFWGSVNFPPNNNSPEAHLKLKSAVSHTINHEIVHALADHPNTEPNEHEIHSSDNNHSFWCVLNVTDGGNFNFNSIFTQKTTTWPICQRHIDQVKLGPYFSENDLYTSGKTNKSIQDDKSFLKISLEQEKYKMYEPILLRIDFINNGLEADTVDNILSPLNSSLKYTITDSKGKVFNESVDKILINSVPTSYIVQPGDTHSVIRRLNKFGYESESDKEFFNSPGHYTPGNYKVYVEGINKGKIYKSNNTQFGVEELNSTDLKILDLYKKNNFEHIINNFRNNPFYDDVYAHYAMKSDNVEQSYNGFIENNINSFYLLDASFIGYLFLKLSYSSENIEDHLQQYKNIYSNSYLSKLLNDKYFTKAVKDRFQRIKNK